MLPRQPGGSATIAKEARYGPLAGRSLPAEIPEILAVLEPGCGYPEHWPVVRWIDGDRPEVDTPETPPGRRRAALAAGLAAVVRAPSSVDVPGEALTDPAARSYRGKPLATMDAVTRQNIDRCRSLGDFGFDLDAAERVRDDAMKLPGMTDRPRPRWHHADLPAENLLMRARASLARWTGAALFRAEVPGTSMALSHVPPCSVTTNARELPLR